MNVQDAGAVKKKTSTVRIGAGFGTELMRWGVVSPIS